MDLYKNLPEKLQNIFWEDDIDNRIEKISERFKLSHTQRLFFSKMIAHLFLGLLPISQIEATVKEEIALREDDNEKLAQEIVRFIVYPIQHLLREVYDDEEFQKIGVKNTFQEEKEERSTTDFGDVYREPIE